MPLKPHPTDPDKLVFTAGDYAAPTYLTSEHAMSMTLRDYFAAQSLKGFIQEDFHTPTHKQIAEACYKLADAMLEARKNEVP